MMGFGGFWIVMVLFLILYKDLVEGWIGAVNPFYIFTFFWCMVALEVMEKGSIFWMNWKQIKK